MFYAGNMFQSRNRESYLFKCIHTGNALIVASFNLVIESLIFSSTVLLLTPHHEGQSFNLVIESLIFSRWWTFGSDCALGWDLFQSRNRESYLFKDIHIWWETAKCVSFNLVIESLIFSSATSATSATLRYGFQSRNRESYLFKIRQAFTDVGNALKFQSRNRESYLFKFMADTADDYACK